MNIIKKIKILKRLIKIAEIIEKIWNSKQQKVKDALWFFETYVVEAKPIVEEIKEILKKG